MNFSYNNKKMVKESDKFDITSLQKDIKLLEKRVKKLEIVIGNKNKEKKKKDPNAPKKYKTAYMIFNIERINEYKKKNPNKKINITEFSKESGELWKKIKEDEKQYEKYKKLEANDKKRFNKEMNLYNKK